MLGETEEEKDGMMSRWKEAMERAHGEGKMIKYMALLSIYETGANSESVHNESLYVYKADEVDARIQELEEEVGIYKDLCTAYRMGDSRLADEALTRLEALKEGKDG